MKVKITQDSKKAGLMGGKTEWQTTMFIRLTQEEQAIIEASNVAEMEIAMLPTLFDGEQPYRVQDLTGQTLVVSKNKWHANHTGLRMKDAAEKFKELLDEVMLDVTCEFEL